jgi:periplasmic protein TonB
MSRSAFRSDISLPDPTQTLERHLLAGFPPDLALDLVLNELVVRAAKATRATAAALALLRGDEMVCRAATGNLAPDLGIPLNTRDGLSGACLETRQPQLSVDTEFDPRVDPAISHRLGIRSILIVPVFDGADNKAPFTGILEVFSTSPAAFSHNDQKVLEDFAAECSRIRRAAVELSQRPPAGAPVPPELLPAEIVLPGFIAAAVPPARRPRYEGWTVALGSLAILATIAVSFLIGSRIGWLHPTASQAPIPQPVAENSIPIAPVKAAAAKSAAKKSAPTAPAKPAAAPADGELVVYEKGKVIFRLKPDAAKPEQAPDEAQANDRANDPQSAPDSASPDGDSIVEASSTTKIPITNKASAHGLRLSPEQAESRLLSRIEPRYPPEALAEHSAGEVVLEVHVAKDGSVSNVHTLSGDPVLAAAASEAVRNWRYQPYRQHGRPAQFQTDVTLTFTLPN